MSYEGCEDILSLQNSASADRQNPKSHLPCHSPTIIDSLSFLRRHTANCAGDNIIHLLWLTSFASHSRSGWAIALSASASQRSQKLPQQDRSPFSTVPDTLQAHRQTSAAVSRRCQASETKSGEVQTPLPTTHRAPQSSTLPVSIVRLSIRPATITHESLALISFKFFSTSQPIAIGLESTASPSPI